MNSKEQTTEEKLNNILDSLKLITKLLEDLIKTYPAPLPAPIPGPHPIKPKTPFRGNDPVVFPWTTDKIYPHKFNDGGARKCLHDACPDCHGTGIKRNKELCVHHISCSCPKCSPICM